MRTPERNFWNWLSAAMGPVWDAQRHEDKYSTSIPDVSYGIKGINGWIELKAYSKWPNSGLPHFTAGQANWLVNRGSMGGNCFIVVKVIKTILVFGWGSAYKLRDKDCNEEKMRELAIMIWDDNFVRQQFVEILTHRD